MFGQVREEMVSNLDWTPTLLQFAGLLGCIDSADYTWDGMNQYDMIMDTEAYSKEADSRHSLVVNVGDRELRSARIIVEHEDKVYKFVKSDSSSATDRWIYSGRLSDVWSVPDYSRMTKLSSEIGKGLPSLKVVEYDENNADLAYSQVYEDSFLFDLTDDESEMYNLLNPALPHYDADLNAALIEKCNVLLQQWMEENAKERFSEPLDFLHERLDAGDPSKTEDGKFVRPFLTNKRYKNLVVQMIEDEGDNVPDKLADLYLNPWVVPEKDSKVQLWELELEQTDDDEEEEESEGVVVDGEVLDVVTEDEGEGVVVAEEDLEVVIDEEDVEDEPANQEKLDVEALEEDELAEDELAAEDFEIDSHIEPKKFRLEVMLPIILAAAIILLAICVLLLYHFVYKRRKPHPQYKLIDASDIMVEADRQDSVPSVSSYETF